MAICVICATETTAQSLCSVRCAAAADREIRRNVARMRLLRAHWPRPWHRRLGDALEQLFTGKVRQRESELQRLALRNGLLTAALLTFGTQQRPGVA